MYVSPDLYSYTTQTHWPPLLSPSHPNLPTLNETVQSQATFEKWSLTVLVWTQRLSKKTTNKYFLPDLLDLRPTSLSPSITRLGFLSLWDSWTQLHLRNLLSSSVVLQLLLLDSPRQLTRRYLLLTHPPKVSTSSVTLFLMTSPFTKTHSYYLYENVYESNYSSTSIGHPLLLV